MVGHTPKISNAMLGVASIFAIVLIVFMAMNFTPTSSTTYDVDALSDSSGYATQSVLEGFYGSTGVSMCRIVVGLSTVYDGSVLAVSLEEGASTTYAGKAVGVSSINADGCVVDINGVSEYLAVGQIQQVGYLYVTVTDVLD